MDGGVDGAVGEAGLDLIAGVEVGGIADNLAVLHRHAIAAAEQQGGVEALGLLLDELQTVLLVHQTAVEEDGETLRECRKLSVESGELVAAAENEAVVERVETGFLSHPDI